MAPDGSPIEEKSQLRDLGVQLSSDLSFSDHINNTISAANKMVGMVLRTFRRRSRFLMITIWKTIIQPKLDYCSQLWSPSDQSSIGRLESVMRNFTSKIQGCEEMNYWERLSHLKVYSQERRRERYQIILVWKIIQGLVDGYRINFSTNQRRGRLAEVARINNNSRAVVKNAKTASLAVKGCKLLNMLPQHLRDLDSTTVDSFKTSLDCFLMMIPDQPTIPGNVRAANTNSLLEND